MTIGILKEGKGENRVALLPEHVSSLTKKEFKVLVEKGAGLASFAIDDAYAENGAEIKDRAAVLKEADLLFGIQSPSEKLEKEKVFIGILGPLSDKAPVEKLA